MSGGINNSKISLPGISVERTSSGRAKISIGGGVKAVAEVDLKDPFGNSNSGISIGDTTNGIGAGATVGADGVIISAGGGIGNSVSIGAKGGITPGGSISISAEVKTPGGGVGVKTETSLDGCTVTVTFYIDIKKFTHTYRNPKCDEREPSPSPSPSPSPPGSPNTPGGPIDHTKIPPGMSLHIAFIRSPYEIEYCRYAWLTGTFMEYDSDGAYEIDPVTSFGERTGGYGYLTSQGLIGDNGPLNYDGFTFCSTNPGSPSPSPSPGAGSGSGSPPYNSPPMTEDKCCKETASMLRKIMKVLDIEKMDKDGFIIPNRMMVAQGSGLTKAKTYTTLLECYLRIMAHGMIFEPDLNIVDSDSQKAGNQALQMKFINATAWAKAMGEMIYEIMDDGNASTNIELRTGITVTQTLMAVADCVRKLDTVLDGLGVQLNARRELIETAFDLTCGEKGFDSKGQLQSLDKLNDADTEALLPSMLISRKNPLKTVAMHPQADSIVEILQDIKLMLQTKSV